MSNILNDPVSEFIDGLTCDCTFHLYVIHGGFNDDLCFTLIKLGFIMSPICMSYNNADRHVNKSISNSNDHHTPLFLYKLVTDLFIRGV